MRPIQPLVRLPHSHIDSDWLSTIECASRTLRKFYEWATDHILSVTRIAPGKSLMFTNLGARKHVAQVPGVPW
jgi:hypothetical protein